jgi:CheY-like chemotaxis protein
MTSAVTILLVDEEPILRRATALMLTGRGGKVSAVSTLGEAVALTRQQIFDVAVIDISVNGPHPTEIFDQLRERGLLPRRVVVCSCGPLDGHEAQPFTAVIPKPYVFEHLVTAVFGPRRRRRPSRWGAVYPSRIGGASRTARLNRFPARSAALLSPSSQRLAWVPRGGGESATPGVFVRMDRISRLRGKPRETGAERGAPTGARRSPATRLRVKRRAVRARRGRE